MLNEKFAFDTHVGGTRTNLSVSSRLFNVVVIYDLVKVAICDELSKKRKEIVMFDSRL